MRTLLRKWFSRKSSLEYYPYSKTMRPYFNNPISPLLALDLHRRFSKEIGVSTTLGELLMLLSASPEGMPLRIVKSQMPHLSEKYIDRCINELIDLKLVKCSSNEHKGSVFYFSTKAVSDVLRDIHVE